MEWSRGVEWKGVWSGVEWSLLYIRVICEEHL